MDRYPAPARPIVAAMLADCAAEPERAVSFQGAPGANSHIAVSEAFPDALPMPCFSFEDAIDAVKDGTADCAMIPIENSLHGRVADIHFMLPESGLVITGEHFLPIRYALMGLGQSAIRRRWANVANGSARGGSGRLPMTILLERLLWSSRATIRQLRRSRRYWPHRFMDCAFLKRVLRIRTTI